MWRTAALITATGLAAATLCAAPAQAAPGDDPCQLAVSFLCHLVPMAPDLDHDVDLTQNQPPADPAAPPPESLPPAPICDNGCN